MCAQFHPTEDVVASASLDMTIRIWDISGLKKKNNRNGLPSPLSGSELGGLANIGANVASAQSDFFGDGDTMVKFVLEGHFRGVNWVSFHPTLPLLLSASDDRSIKLWRMSDSRAWEVDSCRGHLGNISCAVFHPRQDLILSNSEDKTIRIWDMHRRTALQTFRREHDRFWILSAHPDLNLFAAGHDSGLLIFKLERERPAHVIHDKLLYYIKGKELRCYNFVDESDNAIISVERPGHMALNMPRSISYNPAQHAIIVNVIEEEPSYYIYKLPMPVGSSDVQEQPIVFDHGVGKDAVFVARNKLAFLDVKEQVIKVRDLQQGGIAKDILLQTPISGPIVDIFFASINNLLVTTTSTVFLLDTETGHQTQELSVNGVRYTIWNNEMTQVALVSKHTIIIATRELKQLCLIHETIRIKGGAWDDSGVFIYSTLNHIKYLLPHGDNGILKGIDQSIYLTRVKGKKVYSLDRDASVRVIKVDPTEYRFKIALAQKNYDAVEHLIKNSNLVGQSIIAYLRKKGYPEVALHFVQDPKTKFNLALECGNLNVAIETAQSLNLPEAWRRISVEALKQGNSIIVELCYQKLKELDKLSFFYLVTGDLNKLAKMKGLSEKRKDVMGRYYNSLLLGNIESQIELLKEVKQYPLAYLTAKSYGFEDIATEILKIAGIDENDIELPKNSPKPKTLKPITPHAPNTEKPWPIPIPIIKDANDLFGSKRALEPKKEAPVTSSLLDSMNNFNDEFDDSIHEEKEASSEDIQQEPLSINTGGEGWAMEELDIPITEKVVTPITEGPFSSVGRSTESLIEGLLPDGSFVIPSPGISIIDQWTQHSQLAVDHIAAGAFVNAARILNGQIGVVNFKVYKPKFMKIYLSARAYIQTLPGSGGLSVPILRNNLVQLPSEARPFAAYTLNSLKAVLNTAYDLTTKGKFQEAIPIFRDVLISCTIACANNIEEDNEIKEIIVSCKEYIIGLRCELSRRALTPEQIGRSLELSAFFAICNLKPEHSILALRSAMAASFKANNFASAAYFAKRILESKAPEAFINQARTVHAHCSRQLVDNVPTHFKPDTDIRLCAFSQSPIAEGEDYVECVLTGARFKKAFVGKPNPITMTSKIGAVGTGLSIL